MNRFKLKLFAKASVEESLLETYKDKVDKGLQLPGPLEKQVDLTYIKAVLVSSGNNAKNAYFLPEELVSAFHSVANKPLDLEHDTYGIVGHLCAAIIVDQEGNLLDVEELKNEDKASLNKRDMDIIVLGVVYKSRFPDIVTEIHEGRFGVSMECFYTHYDVKLGDYILPVSKAGQDGNSLSQQTECSITYGDVALGSINVQRVLRNVHFGGCALTESPAGYRSVILEVAKKDDVGVGEEDDQSSDGDDDIIEYSLDASMLPLSMIRQMPFVESLVNQNKEVAFASYTGAHSHTILDKEADTGIDTGGHGHGIFVPDKVGRRYSIYIYDGGYHTHKISNDGMSTDKEKDHRHLVEIYDREEDRYYNIESSSALKSHYHEVDGRGTNYAGSHSHNIELSDGTVLRTVYGKRSLKKFLDARAAKYGSEPVCCASSKNPGTCVAYKRYIYSFGGDSLDLNGDWESTFIPAPPMPGGPYEWFGDVKVVKTNWCSLFDTECPSYSDATHPDCVRNVLGRTTKEEVTNYWERLWENRMRSLASCADALDKHITKKIGGKTPSRD